MEEFEEKKVGGGRFFLEAIIYTLVFRRVVGIIYISDDKVKPVLNIVLILISHQKDLKKFLK